MSEALEARLTRRAWSLVADGGARGCDPSRPGYNGGVTEPDSVSTGVHAALFKVVSVADLKGSEAALEWAQSVLDDEQLLAAFAERAVRESEERRAR